MLNTNNWFNYQNFYKDIAKKGYKRLVEVGVWKGHSISFLANELKKYDTDFELYAVDLFEDSYDFEGNKSITNEIPHIVEIYNTILKNSNTRNDIKDIKGLSWDMADEFEDNSVDFVFIDADHKYESVVKDLNAWLPKLRKGGIISGHDYNNPFGVKQAVDEIIKDFKMTSDGVIWYKEI